MNTVYRMALAVLLLEILLCGQIVSAATYYVATNGNDTNPGTSGSPFLTIQRCVNIVAAGDTCTVADGTYADTDGNGVVVYTSTSSNGTAAQPITIKSTNPYGAVIILPGLNTGNAGFYITKTYYIIDGFQITGGTSTGTSASHNGILLTSLATGAVVRNNKIHGIGRSVCSNSVYGFDGVLNDGANSVTIENNLIYGIGRLKNAESGCSTTLVNNDHGIYVKGGDGLVVKRNVIYDTNRGWPIHFYGGTVTNASIYNNVLAGHNTTSSVAGQIMLASTIANMAIKNNISYDATVGMIQYYGLAASGVSVTYNLSDTLEKIGSYAGVTFSNNLQGRSPGFVNAAGNDFHLSTGSAAIDAGTNVGLPFTGAAPDIGAYEFGSQDTQAPQAPKNVFVNYP